MSDVQSTDSFSYCTSKPCEDTVEHLQGASLTSPELSKLTRLEHPTLNPSNRHVEWNGVLVDACQFTTTSGTKRTFLVDATIEHAPLLQKVASLHSDVSLTSIQCGTALLDPLYTNDLSDESEIPIHLLVAFTNHHSSLQSSPYHKEVYTNCSSPANGSATDLSTHENQTFAECQQLCDSLSGCSGFSRMEGPSDRRVSCSLKSNIDLTKCETHEATSPVFTHVHCKRADCANAPLVTNVAGTYSWQAVKRHQYWDDHFKGMTTSQTTDSWGVDNDSVPSCRGYIDGTLGPLEPGEACSCDPGESVWYTTPFGSLQDRLTCGTGASSLVFPDNANTDGYLSKCVSTNVTLDPTDFTKRGIGCCVDQTGGHDCNARSAPKNKL